VANKKDMNIAILIQVILLFFVFFIQGCRFTPFDGRDRIIELNNGKKIVGKIVNETNDSILVSHEEGTVEATIPRPFVKDIRRPSIKDLLGSKLELLKKKIASLMDDEQAKKYKRLEMERYQDELRSAQRARARINDKQKKSSPESEKTNTSSCQAASEALDDWSVIP